MRLLQLKNRVRFGMRARLGANATGRLVATIFLLSLIYAQITSFDLSLIPSRTSIAHAATSSLSRQIPVTARLIDPATRIPVPDGAYSVRYSIYSSNRTTSDAFPSDTDAASRLWTETKTITVRNGILFTFLGSDTAIPTTIDFSSNDLYLGIRINSDPELAPRRKLGQVPSAISADNVQGKIPGFGANQIPYTNSSGVLGLTSGLSVSSAPVASASTSLLQLGSSFTGGSALGTYLGVNAALGFSGNLVDLKVNGTSKFTIDSNGQITAGSIAPAVLGSSAVTSFAKTGGTARTGAISLTQGAGMTITDNGDGTFSLTASSGSGTVTSVGSGAGLTGGPITTTGTLAVDSSIIPFLANTNTYTGINSFSRNGSGAGDATLAVTGTPVNDATSSLIRIGNSISGGNAVANGGTYLGLNAPAAGAGSVADLMNLQVNNTVEFKITSGGALTANGTINGQTITSAASFTGTVTAATGFTATTGGLTVSAGGATITGDSSVTGNLAITSSNATGITTSSSLDLNANSLTSGTGLYVASSSLTSGKAVDIQVSSTGAASNTQTALNVNTAGANATSSQNTYGAIVTNVHTGTSSTNIGGYFAASGGTNNYGLIVNGGNVGIGDASPLALLTVGSGDLFQVNSSGAIAAVVGITSSSNYVQSTGNLQLTTNVSTGTGTSAGLYEVANSLTTGNGVEVSSSSLTTGNLVSLASTSTAAASNTQTVLNIATSGTNGTSAQTTYGLQAANTHAGTTSTNVAGYFTASGGTTANYAGIFAAGNVGIGDTSPLALLTVGSGDLFQVNSSGAIAAAAGVSSSGTIAFSGLATNGPVYTSGGTGTLNSEATLAVARGGTNIASYASGDLLYASGVTTLSKLAISATANQCLITTGTLPSWGSCAGSGSGVTLQTAYNGGATITTVDGTPIAVTAANTTGNGLSVASSTLTSGNAVSLSSTSTGAASNTQTVLNVATSGANGTATQTTYGAQFANTHTGTTSTNVAGYFTASGGTNNYAVDVNTGTVRLRGNASASAWTTSGVQLQAATATFTDTSTAASGVAATAVFNSFGQPTLAATNLTVTTTDAATVYVANAPTAGTNQTITNAWALWIGGGASRFDGNVQTTPTVTTGTGTAAGLAVTENSLTTGNGVDISSTSVSSGNIVKISSTSTAAASNTLKGVNIAISGANGTTAQTVYGQYSSVTNTNATSGTNIAGYFTASGATTANYALQVGAGQVIVDTNGALSTPAAYLDGTWITGGTGTTTKPYVLIQPSAATSTGWNTAGTGLGVNSASGFTGNLADFKVNGTSIVKVDASATALVVPNFVNAGGNSATTITFQSNVSAGTAANAFTFVDTSSSKTNTSGTWNQLLVTEGVSPTSGTGVFNAYNYTGTINQTSTATGSARGYSFNPTVSSSYDTRGFDATFTLTGSLSGSTAYGQKIAITNNQTTNANTVYGQKIGFTDAGSLANTVYGQYVDATTANTADTTYAAAYLGGNVGVGTGTPGSLLDVSGGTVKLEGNASAASWTTSGIQLQEAAATFTDTSTAVSGTAATATFASFAQPTLAATNTGVITTDAATVYVANAPTAGTNQTITNAWSLWVAAGASRFDGNVRTTPTVTTGTGTSAGLAVTANSLTTGNGVDISSTSVSSGSLVNVASTSTAAASNTLKGINVAISGANGTAAQTVYGQYTAVTNTNATSGTNIAGYFSATGATTDNIALDTVGHIRSTQTTAPTSGTPINCGTGSPSSAITTGSTDTAGQFTVTAGTGSPTSCDTVITFNQAYTTAPKVIVLAPANQVGAVSRWYISATGTTTFTVKASVNLGASNVSSSYYLVIE